MQMAAPDPASITALPERWRKSISCENVAGAELRLLRFGAGRPLVFVHTLRTQLDYFRLVLQRLDTTRFEAIAVDLPGHGHSSAPRAEYTADYFTNAVEGLLERCELRDATVVGESIGGTIALTLAARANPRINRVVAVNPYDYGRWGGIRRSSWLANVLFTTILWPGIGPVVAGGETRAILRAVLRGGLYDGSALPEDLLEELHRCGSIPGHGRALRSLSRAWRSWVAAREQYKRIAVPVTLVYGDHDWSRRPEREANARAIPGADTVGLERCAHFASLEQPDAVARLITSEA